MACNKIPATLGNTKSFNFHPNSNASCHNQN
jgi:hypothetical protein